MRTHNRQESAKSLNSMSFAPSTTVKPTNFSPNEDTKNNLLFSYKDELSKKKSTLVKTEV